LFTCKKHSAQIDSLRVPDTNSDKIKGYFHRGRKFLSRLQLLKQTLSAGSILSFHKTRVEFIFFPCLFLPLKYYDFQEKVYLKEDS